MISLITPDRYREFPETLASMYRLRHHIFRERMDWDVPFVPDSQGRFMEMDQYDTLRPHYLVAQDASGEVVGSLRMLPTTGPYMVRNTFPALLGDHEPLISERAWEASRIAVDTSAAVVRANRRATSKLFGQLVAATVEFGMAHNLLGVAFVVDLRVERLLKRCGLEVQRYGPPQPVGSGPAIAGIMTPDATQLARVRATCGIAEPVLWRPMLEAAA